MVIDTNVVNKMPDIRFGFDSPYINCPSLFLLPLNLVTQIDSYNMTGARTEPVPKSIYEYSGLNVARSTLLERFVQPRRAELERMGGANITRVSHSLLGEGEESTDRDVMWWK
jgi:hypothetical protein